MEEATLVLLVPWGLKSLFSFWVAPWGFVLDPVLGLPPTSLGGCWVPLWELHLSLGAASLHIL